MNASGVKPPREPEVSKAFADLHNAIDELGKKLATYGKRLEPILSPPLLTEGSMSRDCAE